MSRKRYEGYWKERERKFDLLNPWEKYQREHDFRELDYKVTPPYDPIAYEKKALRCDYKKEKTEDAEAYWNRVYEEIKCKSIKTAN